MNIVIMEPLSSGIGLAQAVRKLGHDPHIFSANQGERTLAEECKKLAASVTEVDTYDVEAVFESVRDLDSRIKVDAIIPGWEYCVDVTAKVASRLGLPHLSLETAASARNKYVCRERLKDSGIEVPRYALIHDLAEVETVALEVGFPSVIKPIDGGGSLLVKRVDSIDDLHRTLANFANGMLDVDHPVGMPFILEEYVEGREFSIEGFLDGAQPHVIAVTEKALTTSGSYFIETRHIVEAALADDERKELVAYIQRVVVAIGLKLGVFHAEARISSRGPVLIEINCRLAGGRVPRLLQLTKGISLTDTMVRSFLSMENPARIDGSCKLNGIAGVQFLFLDEIDCFSSVSGLDDVRAMPGFEEVELYYRPGEVVPPLTDFRSRVGHILFVADNRATLNERLKEAANRIQFHRRLEVRL